MTDPGGVTSILLALVAGAACATTILARRRAVVLPALLAQFLCTALLLSALPAALVLAYGVVGVCVCGILMVTSARAGEIRDSSQAGVPAGVPFRAVAVLLVALASMSLGRAAIGDGDAVLAAGAPLGAGLLLGLGLLQVGLSEEPMRVGLGLTSMIGGFQIGYTTVETAIAIHGLLIGIPLLIALVVSYLIILPAGASDGPQ